MSQTLRLPQEIITAAYTEGSPNFVQRGIHRGSNPTTRAGLKYEEDLAKWLKAYLSSPGTVLRAGQWIFFEDIAGDGWAQPDFIIESPERILILEAKLSATEEAWTQLIRKYVPLVATIEARRERLRSEPNGLGVLVADGVRPIFGLQVCKRIRGPLGADIKIVHTLDEALSSFMEYPTARVLWHWLPIPPAPYGKARAQSAGRHIGSRKPSAKAPVAVNPFQAIGNHHF